MKRVKVFNAAIIFVIILVMFGTNAEAADSDIPTDLQSLYDSDDFYNDYSDYIRSLDDKYGSLITIKTIGKSVQGRDIHDIIIGSINGGTKITINAEHHQSEYINTILVLNQIERLLSMYKNNQYYNGVAVRSILNKSQIHFIPLVNPDGIEMYKAYKKTGNLPKGYDETTIARTNANGINLNRNYNANFVPNKQNSGKKPFSEPETSALKELHHAVKFDYSVSYHSAGNIIYWNNGQKGNFYKYTLSLAKLVSAKTGYTLDMAPAKNSRYIKGTADFGGYKDWLVLNNNPAITIETSYHTTPNEQIEWEKYSDIWDRNKNVPLALAEHFYRIKNKVVNCKLSTANLSINGNTYNSEMINYKNNWYINKGSFTALSNGEKSNQTIQKLAGNKVSIETLKAPQYITIGSVQYSEVGRLISRKKSNMHWVKKTGTLCIDSYNYLNSLIHMVEVGATINTDTTIYRDSKLSKTAGTCRKGTRVILLRDESQKSANIKYGAAAGWVNYKALNISTKNYEGKPAIKDYIKEYFVNSRKYKSNTDYLIWVNLERQEVNVFKQANRSWKIVKSFKCASGKNSTPTINGVFKYCQFVSKCTYKSYYIMDFLRFYDSYGIHSVLLNYNGTEYDGQVGMAKSHGCLRTKVADISWLKANIPLHTTVVVH